MSSMPTSDKGERMVWATPLSKAVMIPQVDEGNAAKRCISVTAVNNEPTFVDLEDDEFRSKDADMLWSVYRYMF
ncbi:unnamed protein product [Peronospora destructor]|uniref:Uncharacterized protein n=1 Tax=Peronospora destructor TaxID=86335 RepID=A0AAV0UFW7_9STRA|nr:unnamed protein product [Peronospora destructor]